MPRTTPHYMPRRDGDFAAWVSAYSAAIHSFYEAQGLDNKDLEPFDAALLEWNAAYPAHVAAQAIAKGAGAAKDTARAALETRVRPITNFVQSFNKTTDADRATIGITVRNTSRSPAPPPTGRPTATIDPAARLTHHLRLIDDAAPTRRGKPKGTLGAEVWVALVEPGAPVPTNPASLSFLTLTSRATVTAEFKPADGGKTAVYMLRWVSTRGEKGPWGEVCSATVAA